MKLKPYLTALTFIVLSLASQNALGQEGLDPITTYYNKLKESKARGGEETAFLSVGSDMLYALEYFEAKKYDNAVYSFRAILLREPENAYANFLFGVSLAKTGNGREAKPYLEKAARLMPELSDMANAQLAKLPAEKQKSLFDDEETPTKVESKPVVEQKKPATPAKKVSTEPKTGGKLVLGSYVCDYQQYQGNNGFGPAYRSVYKGYFVLKSDGTYRWLDNGGTGKYSYNAKTGKITWLSGHLKTIAPQTTVFMDGQKVASIKVKFKDNYTWGCGCNK